MITKLSRPLLLALLAAVLTFAAGCGGDDDGADAVGSTEEPAQTVGTVGTTTEESDEQPLAGAASADDCRELAELGATLSQAMSGGGNTDDLEQQAKFFEDFADRTPDEVRDDFQVLAEAYTKIAGALADANLQSGQQPDPEALQKLQEATSSIDQARLNEANANIQKWVAANCK
jgi:hypothetical protein